MRIRTLLPVVALAATLACEQGLTDPFRGELSLAVPATPAVAGSIVDVTFQNGSDEPLLPLFPCGGSFERWDGTRWVEAPPPLMACLAQVVIEPLEPGEARTFDYYLPLGVSPGRYRATGSFATIGATESYSRASNEFTVVLAAVR